MKVRRVRGGGGKWRGVKGGWRGVREKMERNEAGGGEE